VLVIINQPQVKIPIERCVDMNRQHTGDLILAIVDDWGEGKKKRRRRRNCR